MYGILRRMQVMLTIVGTIVANVTFAQGGEPALIKVLEGPAGNFKVDSFVTVEDTKWWTPAQKATIDTNLPYKVRNIVTLKLNEESTKFIKSKFTTSVFVKIIYTNRNNSVDSIGTWFTVNFDSLPDTGYNSQRLFSFNDGYRVTTRIDTITTTFPSGVTAWDVLPHMRLENEMQISRFYNFACTSALSSLNQSTASIATTGDLRYTWSPVTGATEYDIEWTFIDSVMLAEGSLYGTVASPDRAKIFEAGSTRNTIYNGDFYVPLFFDNSSYLFVRVRPVQVRPGNQRVEGAWYPSTGGGYYFTGHETGLNWQSTTTFAEEGKRKTVVSYADGSLKQRQTVTRDNVAVSVPQAIASETLYDYQGRPAIQVLPAPNLGGIIKYIHDLNKSLAGGEYEKSLYDSLINPSDYCEASAPQMNSSSGANKYYSSGNPWSALNNSHKALPVANGYAFAETRYTQDNTGRVMAQGGVGQQYQIGSKHETKYYYGKPDSLELAALFGTEAGDPSHYQKNMVRDANGQYSVSYVDMKGRTVATALAGKPDSVQVDTLESYDSITITKKLLDRSATVINGLSMQNTTGLIVTKAGWHKFRYTLSPDSLALLNCNNDTICYDCVYNLEISISDECNNQTFDVPQRFVLLDSNFTIGNFDTLCNNTIIGFDLTDSLNLKEGSYTISKKLTVSRPGYEYYRDSVFLVKNLCKTFEDFYAEELSILQQNCAEPSCASCNSALGTLNDFRTSYAELNGIPSDQLTEYESQVVQAYNTAKANCDIICDSLSENDAIRELMLADMSEGGQYATLDDRNFDKNIFYQAGPGKPYNFQKIAPAYYVDENGKRDSIYNSNDELVPPDHFSITPEQFIAQFKSSWAEALLPQHPEYCKYQSNEQLRYSNTWDKRFSETETYAVAKAKGYLNPNNQSTGIPYIPSYNPSDPDIDGPDPLSSMNATYNGQSLWSILTDRLQNYVNTNGTMRSMWGLATATAHCNDGDTACFTTYLQNTKAFDSTKLCRGELDMAWRSFQQFYSTEKRRIINKWLEIKCPNDIPDRFYQHYPDLETLINGLGTQSTDVNTNASVATDSVNSVYGSNCEAYVHNWIRQIAPCNIPSDSLATITARLVQVCKEGSDATHPFGASSVKPTSAYTYRSFDHVIKDWQASHGGTYDANCNGYLINAPAPYEHPTTYADQPLWTKPDSCQCEKLDSLYGRFLEAPFADSNFAGYLKRKINVDMTQSDIQTLLDMCSGALTCKFLEQPIKLPPQLQCGVNSNCVGCDSITMWHDRFVDSFAVTPDYDDNDSLQSIHNRLYENYMNYFSGFNKPYTAYMLMKDSCPVSNLTCDTLKQVMSDFREYYYNTPSYSIAYNADGCDTTSWIFDASSALSTGKVKFQHMFDNGIVHIPDSLYSKISGSSWTDSSAIKQYFLHYPRLICNLNNDFNWETRVRYDTFYAGAGESVTLSMKIYYGNSQSNTLYILMPKDFDGGIFLGGESFNNPLYLTDDLQLNLSAWTNVNVRLEGDIVKVYINGQLRDERDLGLSVTDYGHFIVQAHNVDMFVDYARILSNSGQVVLNEDFTNACESFSVLNPAFDCNKDDCNTAFTDFYNDARGTSLTGTQIQQLYVQHCGRAAQPCLAEDEELKMCSDGALFTEMIVEDQGPCSDSSQLAFVLATEKFNLYKDSLLAAFDSLYLGKCMQAYNYENLTVEAPQSEFHYTLYYYDQAGNLVKTIPPAGVDMTRFGHLESWKDSVATAKLNDELLTPSHQLRTDYRYNTLNQVKAQKSPDGGSSKFWYDRLGRLVLSQNAKQQPDNWYSYTLYDSIGRITEVGELSHVNGPAEINDSVTRNQSALNELITLNDRRQITNTYYDVPYYGWAGSNYPLVAKNLRNRISYTTYTDTAIAALYDQGTFFSYDIHGNVDTLLQDYRTGVMSLDSSLGQRFKKIVYQYDLISGKVNHVAYQPGKADQFYHRYLYDAENRLTQAQTSADSIVWEREALYSYLMHGPLARTVLGQQKVQGQDYAYTLQGWLKAINGVGTILEMGLDGTTGFANVYVAKDAYSLMLHYNSSDYSSVLSTCNCVSNQLTLPATHTVKSLYNGNIAGMSVHIPKIKYPVASPQTYLGTMYYNYKYDQLNRITKMDAYTKLLVSSSSAIYNTALTGYKEQIKYDANGNILKYFRNADTLQGRPMAMDSLHYKYYAGTNQLKQVTDSVTATNYTEDIDNQDSTNNYVYDLIGNLIQDKHEKIDSIKWNVYGKIRSIHKSGDTSIFYNYDAGGNRISKLVVLNAGGSNPDSTTTWYVRDATGNVMSVYRIRKDTVHQDEIHVYGSSRIGILKPERNFKLTVQYGDTTGTLSLLGAFRGNVFRRGQKFFELANHLGNVLVTISDKKIGVPKQSDPTLVDYYNADVMSANDYYPFGMMMPGRIFSGSNEYRFGFNGKESNNESSTNSYDFGARIYDAKIGRWLSVDPLQKKYPFLSPYNFVANSPLIFIDPDGKKIILTGSQKDKDQFVAKLSKLTGYELTYDKEGNVKIVSDSKNPMSENLKTAVFDLLDEKGKNYKNDVVFKLVNNKKGFRSNRFDRKETSKTVLIDNFQTGALDMKDLSKVKNDAAYATLLGHFIGERANVKNYKEYIEGLDKVRPYDKKEKTLTRKGVDEEVYNVAHTAGKILETSILTDFFKDFERLGKPVHLTLPNDVQYLEVTKSKKMEFAYGGITITITLSPKGKDDVKKVDINIVDPSITPKK